MPIQAIPLALIASLYPFGLAALLLLFQASRPRARSGVFLLGAVVFTLIVGFAVVFAVRAGGLNQQSNQTPRYGLQLAIGLLFLVGAWVIAHRPPRPKQEDDQPSRVSKAVGGSGLVAVFVLGIALYTPSPLYLSALDDVGGTKMSTAAAALWVVIVVVLVLLTIELPILLYWFAPDWTIPKLAALNSWLDRNGRSLLMGVLVALGLWEAIGGIVGLI
jgi:hypothetical protein